MTEVMTPRKAVANWQQVRDEWVKAVTQLVTDVATWSKTRGWPTRRIDKKIDDPRIGEYVVPALMIQIDLLKLLLDPVARFVPSASGLVDLYVMPEYNDVASIYLRDNGWWIQYSVTGDDVPAEIRQEEPITMAMQVARPLTAEEFTKVVEMMI